MKIKTVHICSECGHQTAKWMGRCPTCGEWNTFVEKQISDDSGAKNKNTVHLVSGEGVAKKMSCLELPQYMRSSSGIGELDRVLGGGFVQGSVVLAAGEPGIGKSTLLMQISSSLSSENSVLYVSGEESGWQLKYRAKRLGCDNDDFYLLTETNLERIMSEIESISPDFVIMDSIQTVYDPVSNSTPGSITQVRDCAMKLINRAKNCGMTVIIVGHVNKEGGIAGPKVLEHMVDAVLYFEGERRQSFRIVRAVKNRYGSTNEIGVFDMTDKGLAEVPNPSEMLLSARPLGVSGNCAACVIEGTRPIIAEIQALSAKSFMPTPKRTANGIDYNRLHLVLAVLEKRLGLKFSYNDVYVNVIGGLYLDDPSCDLPMALSLISSQNDVPLEDDLIAFGEIGLSGECRPVNDIEMRVKEGARLGFKKVVLPKGNQLKKIPEGITPIYVNGIYDALRIFKNAKQ